jgi:hypothetical protein
MGKMKAAYNVAARMKLYGAQTLMWNEKSPPPFRATGLTHRSNDQETSEQGSSVALPAGAGSSEWGNV